MVRADGNTQKQQPGLKSVFKSSFYLFIFFFSVLFHTSMEDICKGEQCTMLDTDRFVVLFLSCLVFLFTLVQLALFVQLVSCFV